MLLDDQEDDPAHLLQRPVDREGKRNIKITEDRGTFIIILEILKSYQNNNLNKLQEMLPKLNTISNM